MGKIVILSQLISPEWISEIEQQIPSSYSLAGDDIFFDELSEKDIMIVDATHFSLLEKLDSNRGILMVCQRISQDIQVLLTRYRIARVCTPSLDHVWFNLSQLMTEIKNCCGMIEQGSLSLMADFDWYVWFNDKYQIVTAGRGAINLFESLNPPVQNLLQIVDSEGSLHGNEVFEACNYSDLIGYDVIINNQPNQGKLGLAIIRNNQIAQSSKWLQKSFLRKELFGILHDLSNVMSPIAMASFLMQQKNEDPNFIPYLRSIDQATEKGTVLINLMKNIPNLIAGEKQVVLPRYLFQTMIREFPDIKFESAKNLPVIQVEPISFQQAVLELIYLLNPSYHIEQLNLSKFDAEEDKFLRVILFFTSPLKTFEEHLAAKIKQLLLVFSGKFMIHCGQLYIDIPVYEEETVVNLLEEKPALLIRKLLLVATNPEVRMMYEALLRYFNQEVYVINRIDSLDRMSSLYDIKMDGVIFQSLGTYEANEELLSKVKEQWPDALTVMSGPDTTFSKQPNADVILYDGFAILDLYQALKHYLK
ncbi:MAG: hypothetical protein MK193_06010 [Lentisphaeria bacterium]|nr:hypothetical protein [Lentisphaeria bacterium]